MAKGAFDHKQPTLLCSLVFLLQIYPLHKYHTMDVIRKTWGIELLSGGLCCLSAFLHLDESEVDFLW